MHIATSPYDTTVCDGDACCLCGEAANRIWRDRDYCSECLDGAQASTVRYADSAFPSYIDEPADSDRPTIPVRGAA